MGTPSFAVPSLEVLHGEGYNVKAVVTGADKPRGRGQTISPTPVRQLAMSLGLPVLQPSSLKETTFVHQIRSLTPDLIVVVAFRILPPEFFSIPRLGSFNLHASLLPRYRGAAPINWAIMNGETQTGLTTFLLREKVDTGMIVCRKPIPILPEDDAGTLHDRLAVDGAAVVLETVRLLERNEAHPLPQNDSEATQAPKIRPADCLIDWSNPAVTIHNKIRGLSPHPAARSILHGKLIKFHKSLVLDERSVDPPGTLHVTKESLKVSTNDLMLSIIELQQEGRNRMGVKEFLRGNRIEDGAGLE